MKNAIADGIKATKLKEKDVQRQIKDYLERKGWFVAVTSTPAMTAATKGLPDLIAVRKDKDIWLTNIFKMAADYPRTIWLEVKGPRGVQSDAQKAFQANIEAQGGEYLLANSLEIVMDYLT